jgi:hypothetical protein
MSGYNNNSGANAGSRQFDVSDFQQVQQDEYNRQRHVGAGLLDSSAVPQQQRPADGYGQYGMSSSPYASYSPQQGTTGASPQGGMASHMMNPSFVLSGYGGMGDPYGVSRSMPGGGGVAGTPTGRSNFNAQQPMMAGAYNYGTGRPEYHMSYVSYNPHSFSNNRGGGDYGNDANFQGHDPYGMQHSSMQQQQGSGGGSAAGAVSEETTSMMMGKDDQLNGSGRMFKKPMLQKVTSTIGKPKNTARIVDRDGTMIIEDGDQQWFTGSVRLGLDDDKYWLSELQVYLRSNFAEAFGATEEDIAAPMHGRNKPIALGQVGIRCMHCKSTFVSVMYSALTDSFGINRRQSCRAWPASNVISQHDQWNLQLCATDVAAPPGLLSFNAK